MYQFFIPSFSFTIDLSMGFSRQEYWSGFPSPGDLPDLGTEPRFPALQADSLPSEPPGKPLIVQGERVFQLQLPQNPGKQEFETPVYLYCFLTISLFHAAFNPAMVACPGGSLYFFPLLFQKFLKQNFYHTHTHTKLILQSTND